MTIAEDMREISNKLAEVEVPPTEDLKNWRNDELLKKLQLISTKNGLPFIFDHYLSGSSVEQIMTALGEAYHQGYVDGHNE